MQEIRFLLGVFGAIFILGAVVTPEGNLRLEAAIRDGIARTST